MMRKLLLAALFALAALGVADAQNLNRSPASIGSGSAVIGKVGIDQTTPGVTNGVAETARTVTANQSIAYTGTAGTSAVVNASSVEVIVTCTTDCYVLIGANPTATTSDMYLPAFTPSVPLKVTASTSKVSTIRDSASGTSKIAEFSR